MIVTLGDVSFLEVDLTHRPAGNAPFCGECERPVCFIEEYSSGLAFLGADWDYCDGCRTCGEHCGCGAGSDGE